MRWLSRCLEADFIARGVKVAGLREALDMSGRDYNTVLSVTTAG